MDQASMTEMKLRTKTQMKLHNFIQDFVVLNVNTVCPFTCCIQDRSLIGYKIFFCISTYLSEIKALQARILRFLFKVFQVIDFF